MNRSWSGFLAQNEIVKLHWAAMEQTTALFQEALSEVLQTDAEEQKEPESELPPLPDLNPTKTK